MLIFATLIFFHNSSDPTGLLLWCGLGFFAGIWMFYSGFRMLQRRRLILDTPLSKIRSASMGIVEISGLATGPYTITAPITGRECFYCRTQIWEWKQQGRSKGWVSAASQCIYVPFFVDDNTGRLLVDPRGADLDLHCDFKDEFNTSFFSSADIAPGSVNLFLSRHGIVTSNKLKVEEYCIKPKNSLFILATLAENPGVEVTPDATIEAVADSRSHVSLLSVPSIAFAAGSATNELRTRLLAAGAAAGASSSYNQAIHPSPKIDPSIFKTPQQQKVAAALLQAGVASPEAWAAAGVPWPAPHVSQPAVKKENPNDPDHRPPTVLMKGENNKNFLISWRSQSDLARSLGWKCTLMIWGGPALALLSLYLLFVILGWISLV